MTITVPDDTITVLIPGEESKTPATTLWIQNLSTTVGFWLRAMPGNSNVADEVIVGEDLFLAPAQTLPTDVMPTTLITDKPALVQARWLALQDSGGSATINVGRI